MARHIPNLPLCGCFVVHAERRQWLPLINLDAHATILASTSRTTLTQTFTNDSPAKLDTVRYDFPLYDGVSVVAFKCTVDDRVINGVVREREAAKKTFDHAVASGETAALLEQNLRASDVFTTTLGNVPAAEKVKVEITYLGELEHDAEVDGLRFTIPTSIAPRYDGGGTVRGHHSNDAVGDGTISIVVDAEMAEGCSISNIQSPSHPISVDIGKTSASASSNEPASLRRASARLSLGTAVLDKDFVVYVVADGLANPTVFLETHSNLPNQRALMATLVPRFNLPNDKPEIVFICDRSGSMGVGDKMPNLVAALQIFLKSLPVASRFNVCSFGSHFKFLWDRSKHYDQESLDHAVAHLESFSADFGGTEMYEPLKEAFARRFTDMNLEVFLLTDGEIWQQDELFELVNDNVSKSKGAIRVFSLGIGEDASSALIHGVARAGNGFAQMVATNEKMNKKVIRMLKGALTPHVTNYALEIKYEQGDAPADEDFVVVEKAMHTLSVHLDGCSSGDEETNKGNGAKEPISLFDPTIENKDLEISDASTGIGDKFNNLPFISPPSYLQTPFEIPALFPFNRTTVYVMLSDATPHREPKSIVLTGTSTHGPLRLEIPVTKLAREGTTIHRLAARKAIQELEEGRGWIVHATDGKGNLLKTKHEGQFERMVQREAVRLGVEYQVSGKWCSFVAVQEKSMPGERAEEKMVLGEFEVLGPEQPTPRGHVQLMCKAAAPMAQLVGRGGPMLAQRQAPMAAQMALPMQDAMMAAPMGGPMPAPMGGPMPAPMATLISPPAPAKSFGGASWSIPSFRAAKAAISRFGAPGSSEGALRKRAPSETASYSAASPGAAGGGGHACGGHAGANPLSELASLQTFIGSWEWNAALEKVLNVTEKQTSAIVLPLTGGNRNDILATICAVLYLKRKLASERDAWELMVDKAEGWLEEQTGKSADVLVKIVLDAGILS
ncbi:hypothetical protein DCS_05836 [Drechmeria coniospora]|uniref:von Willebrand domain containing protein n=1 Tax=Drechmeria coniospora TaxID=98403 RepID=A0A151GP23_DRECN|nr:hypothetical protein DCS_05836 [Drechmeria coniospora]KYK58818.1 hypothetical protein DCS_05836 [Drechmeria coniospora]